MMEHKCTVCPFTTNQVDELCTHIVRRHTNDAKFIIHCTICGASFHRQNGFRTHYYRQHYHRAEAQLDACSSGSSYVASLPGVDGADIDKSTHNQVDEALFLLKLKAGHRLSQSAVTDIMTVTRELVRSKLNMTSSDRQVNFDMIADGMFCGLENDCKQNQFFEKFFGYIKPVEVKLGQVKLNRKVSGKYRLQDIDACGYCVPFLLQLQQLLCMPEVRMCLMDNEGNSCAHMCEVADGLKFVSDDYIQMHPNALVISLYSDEFEIVNPIGSHRKKHKITAFYWTLQNLPAKFKSKLSAIQLLALAKSADVKQFGLASLLKDFCDAMQQLHAGIVLDVPGFGNEMHYGKLGFLLADTLAAHSLGGFKEGVGGAARPCRTCEIKKSDMQNVHFASECVLRDEIEHQERVVELKSVSQPTRKYWSQEWGINGDSVLANIPGFEVTKSLLHDPMHDILEGVARYELRAMMFRFIVQKKYFKLNELNSRIINFEYSGNEAKDRPQIIDPKGLEKGSTLGQSAASMMHLMMLLPCLIGDKIPCSDPHWVNYLRLLKILLLSISPIASSSTVQSLETLIAAHNSSFVELYEDESFRPKLHYLIHYPDQILNFGPMRNHWCMRNESKNGFFKQKRWFNFRNLPKSLALYHQQWMCLQMVGSDGQRSDSYLHLGDEVQEGVLVDAHVIPMTCGLIESNCKVLISERVVTDGLIYTKGMIILLELGSEPVFAEINNVLVADHKKYLNLQVLKVKYFDSHRNMFAMSWEDEHMLLPVADLKYKWPQMHHKLHSELLVMLTACDDVWMV
jgi:hypothetical protein